MRKERMSAVYLHNALRQISGVHTACTKVVVHLIPPLRRHTLQ